MCYFYILYTENKNRFYIGHTCTNLQERLKKHNTNHRGYTGSTNDWVIVYSEKFDSKEEAYDRERQVKKWKSRQKILKLIENASVHPD